MLELNLLGIIHLWSSFCMLLVPDGIQWTTCGLGVESHCTLYHDATPYNRRNTCNITLLITMVALIYLVIAYVVDVVGAEVGHVSAYASTWRQKPGTVNTRKDDFFSEAGFCVYKAQPQVFAQQWFWMKNWAILYKNLSTYDEKLFDVLRGVWYFLCSQGKKIVKTFFTKLCSILLLGFPTLIFKGSLFVQIVHWNSTLIKIVQQSLL